MNNYTILKLFLTFLPGGWFAALLRMIDKLKARPSIQLLAILQLNKK